MSLSMLAADCSAAVQPKLIADTAIVSNVTRAELYGSSNTNVRTNPPAVIKNITNEMIFVYETSGKKLQESGFRKPTLYNFKSSMAAGIDADGNSINCEAYYGIMGYIEDSRMFVKTYNHTDKKISIKSVKVEYLDASGEETHKLNGLKSEYKTLPLSKFNHNGLYRFNITFSTNANTNLYCYINGKNAHFCQVACNSNYDFGPSRRQDLLKAIKNANVTPKNSLDLSDIPYPFYTFGSNKRCDTQLWADFSKRLVKSDWSDEYKVFTFCAWISENIAYDNYVRDVILDPRADYYNDLSGKLSTYNIKTGVCYDYANILAIMCRANNIPAITIETSELHHMWTVAYIDGRWCEFDLTHTNKYYVKGKEIKFVEDKYASYWLMFTICPSSVTYYMPDDITVNRYLYSD